MGRLAPRTTSFAGLLLALCGPAGAAEAVVALAGVLPGRVFARHAAAALNGAPFAVS
jgi:hypothetical protein